jgi:hypothetical protein
MRKASRRPLRASSLAATVAFTGLLALAPAAPARSASCAQAGSRTVASGRAIRVYLTRTGKPFGCLRSSDRRTALDRFVDPFYAPFDARVRLVRVAGTVLGYTFVDPSLPVVYVRSVNLATGRYVRRATVQPAADQDPGAASVPALVVAPSGGVAWIQKLDGALQVRRSDRRGTRVLDSRPRIGAGSLRRNGSRLTWRRAGVLRRSSLL